MKFETFGDKKNPVALLVHCIFFPGMASFRTIVPILSEKYYVVVPHLEGLDDSDSKFISTRKQADKILAWLKENKINKISFLLGSCYGSSVGFEILKDLSIKIERIAFDAPTLKHSRLRAMIFFIQLKNLVSEFKKYGREVFQKNKDYKHLTKADEEFCLKVFQKMNVKTIRNLSSTCYDYTLPSCIYREETKMVFLFGENDKSKVNLPEVRCLDYGEIKIIKGMRHLQYMFEKPMEFLLECGLDFNY